MQRKRYLWAAWWLTMSCGICQQGAAVTPHPPASDSGPSSSVPRVTLACTAIQVFRGEPLGLEVVVRSPNGRLVQPAGIRWQQRGAQSESWLDRQGEAFGCGGHWTADEDGVRAVQYWLPSGRIMRLQVGEWRVQVCVGIDEEVLWSNWSEVRVEAHIDNEAIMEGQHGADVHWAWQYCIGNAAVGRTPGLPPQLMAYATGFVPQMDVESALASFAARHASQALVQRARLVLLRGHVEALGRAFITGESVRGPGAIAQDLADLCGASPLGLGPLGGERGNIQLLQLSFARMHFPNRCAELVQEVEATRPLVLQVRR